jgi:hypothetical protein
MLLEVPNNKTAPPILFTYFHFIVTPLFLRILLHCWLLFVPVNEIFITPTDYYCSFLLFS